MHLSSCEHPDEPGIYCSESEFSFIGSLACSRHILKNPENLCSTEICVDDEACLAPDKVGTPVSFEAVAELGCTSVLPYDGIVNRLSGLCIPYDGGLTLVGYTDCRDVEAVDVDGSYSLCNHRSLR